MGICLTYPHQTDQLSYGSIECYEVKLFDQFSDAFLPLISANNTTSSICGYLAPVVALYVCSHMSTNLDNFTEIIANLNKAEVVLPLVNDSMAFIRESRQKYVDSHKRDFKDEEEQRNYLRDWVANYEISDFLQQKSREQPFENIFFIRYVAWGFPVEASRCTHEEKVRIQEELKFKEEKFIMESFCPRREVESLIGWKKTGREKKEFLVFVGDLNGHFVTFVYFRRKKTLILLDTTKNKYLKSGGVAKILASLMELWSFFFVYGHCLKYFFKEFNKNALEIEKVRKKIKKFYLNSDKFSWIYKTDILLELFP